MRARRVRGLDPAAPVADNLERIVRERLDELCSFMPRAATDVVALHNMRIAAKRLRYILEVAHPVFGEYAQRAIEPVKAIQELLGDVHDADVQVPEVREVLEQLVLRDVGQGAPEHRDQYAGLLSLVVELQVRRRERFEEFVALWTDLERKGFRARLEVAVQERPHAAATISASG